MSQYVREVNERDFDEAVLKSKTPVLVDFWAQWCEPCRALAPIVEATAEQYAKAVRVFKLNIDNSPAVAQRYDIRVIPTLILFQDGVEKERLVGMASQQTISDAIERYIRATFPSPSSTSPVIDRR
jgi:thioredoxin 1